MDATEVPEVQETLQENQYDPTEENNLCAKIDTIAESIKKRLQADDTIYQSLRRHLRLCLPNPPMITSLQHSIGLDGVLEEP